jgi:hypothetical protein
MAEAYRVAALNGFNRVELSEVHLKQKTQNND